MDRSPLPVAALVVGIVALLVGLFAYLKANKAFGEAEGASLAASEAAITDKEFSRGIHDVVDPEVKKTEDKLKEMIADMELRVGRLEKQASREEILAEAKRYALNNAKEGSDQLFTQVEKLREEIRLGDVAAKVQVTALETRVEEKVKETREYLKKLVTRWMESGVM